MQQGHFEELKGLVKRLRAPDGCPWDKKQTPNTITPHIIEEAYELVDAIESNNNENIKDELSDVLLHVLLVSEMASESGGFSIEDVLTRCKEKIIRRHPHVFGGEKTKNIDDVEQQWETIKAAENSEMFQNIPNNFPALIHAEKIQKRASNAGFDWKAIDDPIKALFEECNELKDAVLSKHQFRINEEIGDVLFTMVNICRKLGVSAEDVLKKSNNKFKKRISVCEEIARSHNKKLYKCTSTELGIFWDQAKKILKNKKK